MHTLLFLDPGHFHAALTLRVANPRVADEIVVYAPDGPELRDFVALVDRFNRRAEGPTHWRPVVVSDGDPLARLIQERRGDVVVLAGKNGGKARAIRRLHDAGFHVLADKPWLVEPSDFDDIRASLAGPPLVFEMMTGRYDTTARLVKRVVDTADVFGELFTGGAAIEHESVHHLEKLVDGAPLRRPWWFFDVRVQGSGAVDIPTHLVDQTQWLVRGKERGADAPHLLSARGWSTRVPAGAFQRITGVPPFPSELRPFMDGDALDYPCNAEMSYRLAGVVARAGTRWELSAPEGGGDAYRGIVRGTHATVVVEQGPDTNGRRRVSIEPRGDADRVLRALDEAVRGWQRDMPGLAIDRDDGTAVFAIPPALAAGHEAHFALVLDELLRAIDAGEWPADAAARTVEKYALLAEAAAALAAD